MESTEYEAEIVTGRRGHDGRVRLSLFTNDMLALTLEGHGERVPTLLLTAGQVTQLRDALSEVLALFKEAARAEASGEMPPAMWQGAERRTTGQLNK